MGEKSITIQFTNEQIEKYNNQNSRLCFAAGVGNDPAYNVIARSDVIASNVDISWKDEYKIAASKTAFSNGVKFHISTKAVAVKFDDLYTLPENWTDGKITTEKLPKKSFKLLNETAGPASAVIFKVIDGVDKPFYISESPLDPKGGNEVMTPKASIALWFQKNAETGTMVSVARSSITEFDFSARDEIKLIWNGSKFVEGSLD